MNSNNAMIDLYKAVINDCKELIKQNINDSAKKFFEGKNDSNLKSLSLLFIYLIKNIKDNGPIKTFALDYLNNISNETDFFEEINENEIINAYVFLFSFFYLIKYNDKEKILLFEYENFKNFYKILCLIKVNVKKLKIDYENSVKKIYNVNDRKSLKKLFLIISKKQLIKNFKINDKKNLEFSQNNKNKNIKKLTNQNDLNIIKDLEDEKKQNSAEIQIKNI